MRRFDDEALLDRVAAAGGFTRELAIRLADAIAAFHAGAMPTPHHGGTDGMRDVVDDNVQSLGAAPDVVPPDRVHALAGGMGAGPRSTRRSPRDPPRRRVLEGIGVWIEGPLRRSPARACAPVRRHNIRCGAERSDGVLRSRACRPVPPWCGVGIATGDRVGEPNRQFAREAAGGGNAIEQRFVIETPGITTGQSTTAPGPSTANEPAASRVTFAVRCVEGRRCPPVQPDLCLAGVGGAVRASSNRERDSAPRAPPCRRANQEIWALWVSMRSTDARLLG